MIPYGRQDISEEDIAAVIEVLRSEYLTQGPQVPAFEDRLAALSGAAHAVVVNSATSALHIACLALGVGEGDRVWTSPITFVASANAARFCGAEVDFVDIDPETYNMCPDYLLAKLERAAADGTLPKAVIPVHMAGQSCDMARIYEACSRYGVRIIEDASHAVGGSYRGERVGGCKYSDITVFSFHPVKIVTTGEGGAALTNDTELAESMRLARSHGITRDQTQLEVQGEGPWYYEQQSLGYNYRMTDICAALGSSQLDRLDLVVSRRREIAEAYNADFASLPVTPPQQLPETASAWHLYILRVAPANHRATFEELRASGIAVNLHYIPVYRQPYYRRLGFIQGYCPNAEAYYAEAISLPLYPNLAETDRAKVVETVRRAVRS